MAARQRLFPFNGSNEQYIQYLEQFIVTHLPSPGPPRPNSKPANCESCADPHRGSLKKRLHSTSERQAQTTELNFVIWKPKKQRVQPNATQQWRAQLDTFVRSIPKFGEWTSFRKDNHFYSIEENRSVLAIVLRNKFDTSNSARAKVTSSTPPSLPAPPGVESLPWEEASYRYAQETATFDAQVKAEAASKAKIFGKIANFRHLIVATNCYIMYKTGVAKEKVIRIMRECVCDTGESNLEGYLRGARWVNGCITQLSKTQWGSRSAEVFFLNGRPLSYYARIASDTNTLQSFVDRLKAREDILEDNNQESSAWIPLSIPCVVHRLGGVPISLQEICDLLQYDYKTEDEIYYKSYMTEKERQWARSAEDPTLFNGYYEDDPMFATLDPTFL
ncbi:uncharacterized protein CIMG_08752 [Coccidioides immitis RS]|uniref:Uncharacterized protein n=1 Tax=Coccidioides immitis (strain RS) TaxID=246410 RepID=J3K647_COCIM|nr:uncharacterized protein CIMG_08752 [Coccidioides immitis RS]EAS30006.3 hypothetical protein CIMG_08752 [Coccidioides immitis RS]